MRTLSFLAAAGLCLFAAACPATPDTPRPADWSARDTTRAIAATLQAHVFDPAQLRTPAYRRTMAEIDTLAAGAPTRAAYIDGFNRIWRAGPFSHVQLAEARTSAAQLADHLDRLRVGGSGARLDWQGDIAILTVTTMMGLDTIEQIDAAYAEIAEKQARAVVIDLRANEGGAFAVRPLVAHVLPEPLDAGLFMGAAWATQGRPLPGIGAVRRMPAWQGWSLKAFWSDVERDGLLRIRFEPAMPVFTGPTYVLTSRRTASAAELAADALQARRRAIVVGETTAGRMLSQKMYDVPGGLQLSLPIADYRSHHGGRLEGKGVQPDIKAPADEALARALALAAKQSGASHDATAATPGARR